MKSSTKKKSVDLNSESKQAQWISDEQKQGYFNYVQYLGITNQDMDVKSLALYLIQKSHESAVWFSDTVGDQVKSLENQVLLLQEEARALKKTYEDFQARLLPVGRSDSEDLPSQSHDQQNIEHGFWVGKKQ